MGQQIPADILTAVREAAPEKKLPCAMALALAGCLGVPAKTVGLAANQLGIKVVQCQLGCFN